MKDTALSARMFWGMPMGCLDERSYQKTKLLLNIYRDVIWRTEEVLRELDDDAMDMGGKRLAELLDFMALELEHDTALEKLESRLTGVAQNKIIIDLIDKSLVKLKSYPVHGQRYFDIITMKYVYRYPYTDEELCETLRIGQTMFYRRKKEATYLLAGILWGYVVPAVLSAQAQYESIPLL